MTVWLSRRKKQFKKGMSNILNAKFCSCSWGRIKKNENELRKIFSPSLRLWMSCKRSSGYHRSWYAELCRIINFKLRHFVCADFLRRFYADFSIRIVWVKAMKTRNKYWKNCAGKNASDLVPEKNTGFSMAMSNYIYITNPEILKGHGREGPW